MSQRRRYFSFAPARLFRAACRMATTAFPNNAIAELASVLGEDNVRTLVRTFLRDFPASFQALTAGDRKDRHRRAHSMKSSSRLMGALELSRYMAGLEARFSDEPDADISTGELAEISTLFEDIGGRLREFLADSADPAAA